MGSDRRPRLARFRKPPCLCISCKLLECQLRFFFCLSQCYCVRFTPCANVASTILLRSCRRVFALALAEVAYFTQLLGTSGSMWSLSSLCIFGFHISLHVIGCFELSALGTFQQLLMH